MPDRLARRPPAVFSVAIVVLAILFVFAVFDALWRIEPRAAIYIVGGITAICLLVAWGARGI